MALAMLMLTASLFVFGAWTFAPEETAEAQAMSADEEGIVPYGGGQADMKFEFDSNHILTVSITAENWWWPGTDQAIVVVDAAGPAFEYRLKIEFVWTNTEAKTTYVAPNAYNDSSNAYCNLDKNNAGNYTKNYYVHCNESGLDGNAGGQHSCEYINVYVSVRYNGQVKTENCTGVHF